MNDDIAKNRAQYLAWLRNNFPELYRDAIASIRDQFEQQQLSGFFDSLGTAFTSVVTSVSNNLPQLAQTYSQYAAQKDLLKTNTIRAQQGLAPLQYNQEGQLITATGLPYTAQELQLARQSTLGINNTTLLLFVAGFVALLIILMRK